VAPRQLAQKYDLQQQVAQLVLKRLRTSGIDGVDHLARLFEHVLAQRFVALLPIPGAAVRGEQPPHERDQARAGLALLLIELSALGNLEAFAHARALACPGRVGHAAAMTESAAQSPVGASPSSELLVRDQGAVRLIRLQRPAAKNALTLEVVEALHTA